MCQSISNFITTYLDPPGIVLGYLVLIPIVSTWWQVTFGRKRRERKYLQDIRKSPGARPAVLIVDFQKDRDISHQVHNYMQQDEKLKDIPNDRIFMLSRNTAITPDDIPGIIGDLRAKIADIYKAGATKLHLFYAGPVFMPFIIGAELANSFPTLIYHYQDGSYRPYTPLRLLS